MADEVRTLASRTSESTTKIEEQIKQTQAVALAIGNHVQKLDNMIAEAVEKVEGARDVMQDIKAGSENVVQQVSQLPGVGID